MTSPSRSRLNWASPVQGRSQLRSYLPSAQDDEVDNSASYMQSPDRGSDGVLLRCRDALERLHDDLEEERGRRREMEQRAAAADAELQGLRAELEKERSSRRECDGKVARLERHVADSDSKLAAARQGGEASSEQLQRAKAEIVQQKQELFAKGLKFTELEGAFKRLEAKASLSQEDVHRGSLELGAEQERLSKLQSELAALRVATEVERQRADRAGRLAEEHEQRWKTAQHELDTVQAAAQAAEDSHRQHLLEAKSRQDRLAASWQQREAELRRSVAERAGDAEQHLATHDAEITKLRQRSSELETEVAKAERQLLQAQGESTTIQTQLQAVHQEQDRTLQEMHARGAQVSKVQAELEAAQARIKRLSDERRESQDQWFELSQSNGQLTRQVEELRQQLTEKVEELHKRDGEHVSAVATVQLQVKDEAQRAKETAVSELHRVTVELAEHRSQKALYEERLEERASHAAREQAREHQREREELQRAQLRLQEEHAETKAAHAQVQMQLAQLTEHTSSQASQRTSAHADLAKRVEELTSELRTEQEKNSGAEACAKEALAGAQHTHLALRHSEEELHAATRLHQHELAREIEQRQDVEAQLQREARERQLETWHFSESAASRAASDLDLEKKHQATVGELKQKYEKKLKKLQQHVSDRTVYEQKLKNIIETEVDVLHRYNNEVETCGTAQRLSSRRQDSYDDLVADRMRGVADKVERKILRSLNVRRP